MTKNVCDKLEDEQIGIWCKRQLDKSALLLLLLLLYSTGLLQLVVLRYSRWFDEPPAVSSERRGMSHHRSPAMRAHHAIPTSAPLAVSPQSSGFHDIHPRLSFVGWHRSCLSSWRMYAGYRRWPTSFAVCWQ